MALKKLFLNYSFAFNTHYEHFYNLERLYSCYLSDILWYKRNLFLVANAFNKGTQVDDWQCYTTNGEINVIVMVQNIFASVKMFLLYKISFVTKSGLYIIIAAY